MAISKAQSLGVWTSCKCCGEAFRAFPIYRPKSEGGGLRTPEYKRGHHPRCKETQTQNKIPWNTGIKKGEHPSTLTMGFKEGHPQYNKKSIHSFFRKNPIARAMWIESKLGQVPWNKGKTKDAYKNGFKAGSEHGNWKGGKGGIRDTGEWQRVRLEVYKRDNFTCQECGDRNHEGRGKRISLDAHHIQTVNDAPELALVLTNIITLCKPCHRKTHNFGAKAIKHRGKKSTVFGNG